MEYAGIPVPLAGNIEESLPVAHMWTSAGSEQYSQGLHGKSTFQTVSEMSGTQLQPR